MSLPGTLKAQALQGIRDLKIIPLVIRYAAGLPTIAQNPTNEQIALTDLGVGSVRLLLADASLAPLMVQATALPTAAGTLELIVNLATAPTTTQFDLLVKSGADGATSVDPVDLHILIVKHVGV